MHKQPQAKKLAKLSHLDTCKCRNSTLRIVKKQTNKVHTYALHSKYAAETSTCEQRQLFVESSHIANFPRSTCPDSTPFIPQPEVFSGCGTSCNIKLLFPGDDVSAEGRAKIIVFNLHNVLTLEPIPFCWKEHRTFSLAALSLSTF